MSVPPPRAVPSAALDEETSTNMARADTQATTRRLALGPDVTAVKLAPGDELGQFLTRSVPGRRGGRRAEAVRIVVLENTAGRRSRVLPTHAVAQGTEGADRRIRTAHSARAKALVARHDRAGFRRLRDGDRPRGDAIVERLPRSIGARRA